jgi:hypothetical protein
MFSHFLPLLAVLVFLNVYLLTCSRGFDLRNLRWGNVSLVIIGPPDDRSLVAVVTVDHLKGQPPWAKKMVCIHSRIQLPILLNGCLLIFLLAMASGVLLRDRDFSDIFNEKFDNHRHILLVKDSKLKSLVFSPLSPSVNTVSIHRYMLDLIVSIRNGMNLGRRFTLYSLRRMAMTAFDLSPHVTDAQRNYLAGHRGHSRMYRLASRRIGGTTTQDTNGSYYTTTPYTECLGSWSKRESIPYRK